MLSAWTRDENCPWIVFICFNASENQQLLFPFVKLIFWLNRNNQQDATLQQNLLFQSLLKAQHVSSGILLIIRSSKLYLQHLVYIPIWWPAVDNGRSPGWWFIWIKYKTPVPSRILNRNHQQDATLQKNLLFQSLLKAQHVSSGVLLIIRSSKLYLQHLVYIPMWWPAVDNGRSPGWWFIWIKYKTPVPKG
jgi:hypothetical protein